MNEFANTVWKMVVDSHVLNLVAALLILLAGWIVSLLLKKITSATLARLQLNRRLALCLPEDEGPSRLNAEKFIGAIVFWFFFLLTVLASLSSLKLSDAATPIKTFLDKVMSYLPNLIAGLILLFVAWIVASALKYIALTAMSAFHLDEKLEKRLDTKGEECKLSFSIAAILYWLVFLCFAPAILTALKIDGITAPLEAMLKKIFEYLPNLIAAAAIAFVGLFAAGILRKVTVKFCSALHIDALSDKAGADKVFDIKSLANLVGVVVYALVSIPVLIASLTALKIENLTASVSGLFNKILNATGNIFGAMLILFVAYIVGRFISRLSVQLLDGFGFNKLFETLGFSSRNAKDGDVTPAVVVGQLVMIAVMVFAFIGAFEILQFDELATLLRQFIPFSGKIIVAIIVFMIGIYLANLATSVIKNKGFESTFLSLGLRVVILFFAGAVALHSTDIGGPIVQTAFTLILGAISIATAIAFGIGGRDLAAKKLEEWSHKDEEKK